MSVALGISGPNMSLRTDIASLRVSSSVWSSTRFDSPFVKVTTRILDPGNAFSMCWWHQKQKNTPLNLHEFHPRLKTDYSVKSSRKRENERAKQKLNKQSMPESTTSTELFDQKRDKDGELPDARPTGQRVCFLFYMAQKSTVCCRTDCRTWAINASII